MSEKQVPPSLQAAALKAEEKAEKHADKLAVSLTGLGADGLPAADENQIIAERRAKLTAIRQKGQPYPNDYRPSDFAGQLIAQNDAKTREQLEAEGISVNLSGRMMLKRVQGKASFATIQDSTGRMQLWLNDEGIGADAHESFKHWDLGDILAAEGKLFKTMKGELSVRCSKIRLLSKSLRPLPDKFHGLADQEVRYRQRYVDLIVSEETRKRFATRSKATNAIRNFMVANGFLEVETPMLPSPSSPITMRSISRCSCASRPSCTSSD
jgi:lysyl-tRNA synthetase, class II